MLTNFHCCLQNRGGFHPLKSHPNKLPIKCTSSQQTLINQYTYLDSNTINVKKHSKLFLIWVFVSLAHQILRKLSSLKIANTIHFYSWHRRSCLTYNGHSSPRFPQPVELFFKKLCFPLFCYIFVLIYLDRKSAYCVFFRKFILL